MAWSRKKKAFFIILPLLIITGIIGWSYIWFIKGTIPLYAQELAAPVSKGVEIYRDEYGVPHIFASVPYDLFFAQGYVQAQDRLWQLDISRRGVSGTLSEILGEEYLDIDHFIRTVGFRRAAEASLPHFSPSTKEALEAFADGINYFIETNSNRLPLEFTLLRYKPQPWTPLDTLAIGKYMAWDLGGNMNTELFLAAAVNKVGMEMAVEIFPSYPEWGPVIVPSEEEFAFSRFDQADLLKLKRLSLAATDLVFAGGFGSNNWVVKGDYTQSGKPLLANDMHLGIKLPSIWYQNHLHLEGDFSVTGATFPGVPGVIVGHNGHIAWGVTNVNPDIQDLYIEKLHPQKPFTFLYLDEWSEAEVIREEIWVKDKKEPVYRDVVITRNGPLISQVLGEIEDPLSLKWTAHGPTLELEAFLKVARARNWKDFCAALENFHAPPQNFVYADVQDNIGYRANGLFPIRNKGLGLLPVPGWHDQYQWTGYVPWEEIPQLYNPPEGCIITANHKVVDEGYPYFLTYEWAPPYRAMSIERKLQEMMEGGNLTLEEIIDIQNNWDNLQAEKIAPRVIEALEKADLPGETAKQALKIFQEWSANPVDCPDAPGALIYHQTYLNMAYFTFSDELGEELYENFLCLPYVLVNSFDRLFLQGESPWFNNIHTEKEEKLEDIIEQAFMKTVRQLEEKLGGNPAGWKWGKLHTITFKHPIGSQKILERFYNRGPFPQGGSHVTAGANSFSPARPFEVTSSAPLRYGIDMGRVEEALDILASGNSGNPFHKHYDDQMEKWLAGSYKQMLYNREQIEALSLKMVLSPR